MMQEFVPGSDIYTVDSLYSQPGLASIHIIQSRDRVALVDTGTQFSAPQVLDALASLGRSPRDVELIILTHIHLDHAGGAGTLIQLCPTAKLLVHKKGARHMVNPDKLIAGATAVYGERQFKQLYGEITPVDAQRIMQPEDNETVDFAGRPLLFIDTPGHADHHHCIVDQKTNSVFTGDTLGVGYRALRSEQHAFVATTTTPVQFNPRALHQSIDRVMSFDPQHLYLTHYSELRPSGRIIAGLHEQIDDFVALTEQVAEAPAEAFEQQLSASMFEYLVRRCLNELPQLDEQLARQWLTLDAELNAQGLAFWWQHRRETQL